MCNWHLTETIRIWLWYDFCALHVSSHTGAKSWEMCKKQKRPDRFHVACFNRNDGFPLPFTTRGEIPEKNLMHWLFTDYQAFSGSIQFAEIICEKCFPGTTAILACACLHLCSVENCIKEENEEDFVQLLADHSLYNGDCVRDSIPAGFKLLFHESRDATEFFSRFHGDLPHISKTSESPPVNYCINAESTRKAIEGDDNRHAVGHSIGQGIAGNMNEMCAFHEIRKLVNDVLPQACVDITTCLLYTSPSPRD